MLWSTMRTSASFWSTAGTESVGTGWTRTRSSGSTRPPRSTALPRRCSATGLLQQDGPEAGLHERATAPEVCAYYERVLRERLLASGKVSFYPNCDYLGEGRFVSRFSGRHHEVRGRPRIVDARYLSPSIPATTPPPYGVAEGVTALAVNDLVSLGAAASEYVIVGSGKTATDACIWLLDNGVDPGAICWVRPRTRGCSTARWSSRIQSCSSARRPTSWRQPPAAASADDVFFRLEDAGVMLRIDRSVTPTMAKVPTLAQWELDRLRTIDRVVRLGHLRHVQPGRLVLDEGEAVMARDAVVVHCAASGLKYPPLVPIWGREGDHATADPHHVRLLRCGARRIRRGDARGRRREEPAVPARAVLQHTGRLGTPAGARQSGVVLHLVSHHQGLGRRGLAQPGTHPT